MKGTLLLLGLLVTGELSFQTTEECVPFFKGYVSLVSGLRFVLHQELQAFNATKGEKMAFEKIQDCYKFMGPKIMEAMISSPECQAYYTRGTVGNFIDIIFKLLGL
ncbi:secretoglobin family 2B member 20-like [Mus caroli]|uniref:ABPBGI n=1 Tax=Mus caroli TaxID=10089 RepID=A0A6M4RSX2_MUSCR|nr:secretoglobin family 2B member 20-like [Mus caroli]QJS38987.1 ABPBGI [Mus caroli]